MTEPVDPAQRDPNYDWRSEVNWPQVKRLTRLHALYWTLGGAEFVFYKGGLLTSTTRIFVGLLDYILWAILAVMLFRLVSKPRYYDGSDQVVSVPTFLILFGFIASLIAFIVLLNFIDLGTVELFPNPETSVQVKIFTILAGMFILIGFGVAWRGATRSRQLIAWIKEAAPQQWSALPWFLQHIGPGLAIERLRHKEFRNNDEFQRRYSELNRLRRQMIFNLIVGSVCIAIVIHGTSFWGWRW